MHLSNISYIKKTIVFKQAIYIVGTRRTSFGTFGGKLKDYTAIDLQEAANRVIGNVCRTSTYAIYLARHAALRIGVPIHVPALNVNRLCGSVFQPVINGGQEIQLGESNIILCDGAETENLAKIYKITRQEADEFALQFQKRWQQTNDQGLFRDEIERIQTKEKRSS
ncbi:unnamed protein product [Rotaria magnacalcarata]|uniref:Thiolase N-terminal domain-containing protein n=1 Tax=Rotaria magnacalcarata TaxID=392030 RepID=A0A820KYU8_9BILA|nr:unnamed protein product [Rotaria magnacalcarata]CAF3998217.1 unnamed protein product [Rotaria magnacalcarata]CAF4347796.1 unnamed protein product [Rotaria magnacalcarata]